MSEEQKKDGTESQPERRKLTQKEVEQLRRKRDLAYKRKLQEVRAAEGTEQRQEIYNTLHRTHVEEKPTTFKKKWENYWYHYRVLTFVLVIGTAIVAWFIHDMVTTEKYDLNLMIICAGPYEEEYTSLQETLTPYMKDYDEDGNVDIYIENIQLNREQIDQQDPQIVMAMTTKYTVSFTSGSNFIYLLDQQYYDFLIESGIELTDVSQLSDAVGVQGDRYALTDDVDFAGLSNKEDLYLVMRDFDNVPNNDKQKVIDCYNRELEVFKHIVAE